MIEFVPVLRTLFVPLKIGTTTNPATMILTFDETFYLAVPYLEDDDDLGDLVFYLEEPASHLNQNSSELRDNFKEATKWARGFKKKVSTFYRSVARKLGTVLRKAVCESPLYLIDSVSIRRVHRLRSTACP